MKNKLYLILRIFISVSLVAVLCWMARGNFDRIVYTIKNANVGLIFLGFLFNIISAVVISYRLVKVLSVQNVKLSFKEGLYLCFLGYFFNNFLPTSIGGDVVKAYYAGKKFNRKTAAFSGVFMDRLLAMVPFTFIPAFALLFLYNKIDNPAIVYSVLAMFVFTVLVLIAILNKKVAIFFKFLFAPFKKKAIYKKLTRIYDSLNIYRHHKIILSWSFFLSILTQALSVIGSYILGRSVGVYSISLGVFFLLVPIIGIIGMLPSINGIGPREASAVYMLKKYVSVDKAFAISVLMLAMLLGLSIIGAVIYIFKKDIYNFKPEMEADAL